jgi:putative Mg2+ transporter-C (MgtC) family protein
MNAVWDALVADFSDLGDVADVLRVTVRLVLAAALGAVLGWERETKGKAAGLRTHMLVALGASLFVLAPQRAGFANPDLSRVIQGLVAGIGFLGAGVIVTNTKEEQIHGLTTAAGLWLTAAIGIAAGMGREALAALATLLTWVILAVLPRLEAHAARRAKRHGSPPQEDSQRIQV